ncbi:hypothetical protein MIN45_P1567 [Methylomarinovum tepidoasis]|uniref:Response regulator n=2 Tax=Methylomarinovum tepidoasis TaxID=2840183 RepID=A0AAU9CNI6_9GAMM|nr:hypothetical protein MIN45_P1567 [Methylomarinovum sp. IN45]
MPASVLVVEDDEITCLILTTQLQQWGLEVQAATTAETAWSRLQTQAFTLALVDLQLSGQRGETVVERLRRTQGPNQTIPVIAISGNLDPDTEEHLKATGFDGWLLKPVTPERLRKTVTAFLPLLQADSPHHFRPRAPQRKFLTELPAFLNQIEDFLRRQRWDEALPRVHKLRGGAGFCGFTTFYQLAGELEAALAQADPSRVERIWNELKKTARHLDDGGPAASRKD